MWNKLDKILKCKKMTLNKLATLMGVSNSVIYALRDGKIKKPSFELMCKIADVLDINLDYFRDRKE